MLHQSMLAALCHPADRSTINGKNKRMVTNIPAPGPCHLLGMELCKEQAI